MPYTEMDNSTLALLPLISERARKERKLQFTSLAHLLNKKFLRECYLELGRDRAGNSTRWESKPDVSQHFSALCFGFVV